MIKNIAAILGKLDQIIDLIIMSLLAFVWLEKIGVG
jgi:hypothetical protein